MPLDASDFAPVSGLGDAVPVDGSAPAGTSPDDQPYGVSESLTPSGLELYYQAGPKRLYRVYDPGQPEVGWVEVPSVTTVLGVLDKSGAIGWWSQGVGAEGILILNSRGVDLTSVYALIGAGAHDDARKEASRLLTEHKLSVNHVRDQASDRGLNVHAVFEQWADDQRITPQPVVFPEHEQGYVQGLADCLLALAAGQPTEIQSEVMVASPKHHFAGRYDLRLTFDRPVEVVKKIYPKKAPIVGEIPAGRWLLDLKTSKDCYPTHALQLAAYAAASVECGYEPVDHLGVIHVTADGRYELREALATFEDFLDVRLAHQTMQKKGWFA